jgi:hypothetical protein
MLSESKNEIHAGLIESIKSKKSIVFSEFKNYLDDERTKRPEICEILCAMTEDNVLYICEFFKAKLEKTKRTSSESYKRIIGKFFDAFLNTFVSNYTSKHIVSFFDKVIEKGLLTYDFVISSLIVDIELKLNEKKEFRFNTNSVIVNFTVHLPHVGLLFLNKLNEKLKDKINRRMYESFLSAVNDLIIALDCLKIIESNKDKIPQKVQQTKQIYEICANMMGPEEFFFRTIQYCVDMNINTKNILYMNMLSKLFIEKYCKKLPRVNKIITIAKWYLKTNQSSGLLEILNLYFVTNKIILSVDEIERLIEFFISPINLYPLVSNKERLGGYMNLDTDVLLFLKKNIQMILSALLRKK